MAFEYIGALLEEAVQSTASVEVRGRVEQVVGTIIRAVVPGVKVGELCILRNPWEDWTLRAEVVGFVKQVALLTPLGDLQGISPATEVIPTGEIHSVPVGEDLLGRVLNGLGDPIDGGPPLKPRTHYPVYADPPNPMLRKIIDKPISLGLRVLDGVLTCGEGQRMGIFAAAGGGKSTLLSSIIKGCSADVCVLALIGERGREVREFIENDLGPEGRKKAVLVVSTSDRSSMERLKAAYTATAVAEYFRDQHKSVLLMMDSVTRFGRAQREIGLAAGDRLANLPLGNDIGLQLLVGDLAGLGQLLRAQSGTFRLLRLRTFAFGGGTLLHLGMVSGDLPLPRHGLLGRTHTQREHRGQQRGRNEREQRTEVQCERTDQHNDRDCQQ